MMSLAAVSVLFFFLNDNELFFFFFCISLFLTRPTSWSTCTRRSQNGTKEMATLNYISCVDPHMREAKISPPPRGRISSNGSVLAAIHRNGTIDVYSKGVGTSSCTPTHCTLTVTELGLYGSDRTWVKVKLVLLVYWVWGHWSRSAKDHHTRGQQWFKVGCVTFGGFWRRNNIIRWLHFISQLL